MPQTLSEEIAAFSTTLSSKAISREVIEKTKSLVLDTIGLCAASAKLDFGIAVTRLVTKWGGIAEATVIGSSVKVPVQGAAFCNGVLAHGQDYDDTHTESVVHSSAALVPVALAVAESIGASGEKMLEALIAGTEIAIRIALPARNKFHQRGFHTTSVATTFGSALVTCKLLGLNQEQTVSALGTCGSVLSGLVECVPAGANAKRLHAGWGAHSGIVAVQLANEGFGGPSTIFDGKCGLFNAMLRGETIDTGETLEGLGREWEMLDTRPKVYPCCHYLQAFIDCADTLRRSHSINADDIETIECQVAQGAANIVCEPWSNKLNPTSSYGARFSLPFAVSVMLAKGKAGVEEFSEETLQDPAVRKLMEKVTYKVNPKYEVKDMPAWVQLTMRSGTHHGFEIPVVHGDRNNPISAEALASKFRANTKEWTDRRVADITDCIQRLETLENVKALTGMLA